MNRRPWPPVLFLGRTRRLPARKKREPRSEPRLFGGGTYKSGCVLRRQCSDAFAMPLWRSDDPHLLPVVGEFSATLQANNVRAGQAGGLRTPRGTPDRYWKTIAGVMA